MVNEIEAPTATIIAAGVAAFIGLIGIILAKENKISEFRQIWVDDLRKDIVSLLSHFHQILPLIREGQAGVDRSQEIRSSFLATNMAIFAIRLRLNPSELEAKALLLTLDDIEKFSGAGNYDESEALGIEKELCGQAQKILKSEWIRVRKGERAFRAVKDMLLAATGLFVLFAILSSFR